MPVPGLYWADAASIGPVQARYWQLTPHFQGFAYDLAAYLHMQGTVYNLVYLNETSQ